MSEPRILVVRLGSLGDIVHTLPAVAALRDTFPLGEIAWITHPRWESLVRSSGLASRIYCVESRSRASVLEMIKRLRQDDWTLAVDYQGLWKSAALPLLSGVRRRIGFSPGTIREFGVPLLYTDRVAVRTVHIAEQNGELSTCAGARRGVGSFALSVPPQDENAAREYLRARGVERYIVLSPGGGWRSKCWPPERFGSLCRKIRDSLGLLCIVNHGPGEADLAETVREASGNAEPLFYNEALGPLMAVLRGAACIVGGDTGPLHLAIALGTRSVALFGPTDPARNGPYRCSKGAVACDEMDIVLRNAGAITSHKRRNETDPSMLAIDVEMVFAAVQRCVGACS